MNSSLCTAAFWFGSFLPPSSFLFYFFFFPTKLGFSVLAVNGDGSFFMKQMVFAVVTVMDLLAFVSRNDEEHSSLVAPTSTPLAEPAALPKPEPPSRGCFLI